MSALKTTVGMYIYGFMYLEYPVYFESLSAYIYWVFVQPCHI